MKNHIFSIFVIMFCLPIIGCDFSPVYTVSIAEEAVITQNGKIIGDAKEPGLHFKIPVLQDVHKVEMYKIREFSLPVPKSNALQAKIMWTVKDAKQFYIKKRNGDVSKLLRSTVKPVFSRMVKEYDSDAIRRISSGQNKSPEYTDDVLKTILKHLQEPIDGFGIELRNIFFENIKT